MQESGKSNLVIKKAYEIAYAMFRIAANMGDAVFAEQFKKSAILTLGAATQDEYGNLGKQLAALEYLIRFSMDVNILGFKNGEIVLGEIAGLMKVLPEKEDLDIAGIFSKPYPVIIRQEEVRQNNPANSANHETGNSITRQATILEQIRQTGNCRIKDIQDILPESSERTIRYDLQSLLEQNLIERVGPGGPSVYYRIKG